MSFGELIVRFVVGGLFVSAFAILSDVLKPKCFAGLFGAAPSIALATLLLTVEKQGAAYAAVEAWWMIAGAFAFFLYAWSVVIALVKSDWSAKTASFLLLVVWLGIAVGSRLIWTT